MYSTTIYFLQTAEKVSSSVLAPSALAAGRQRAVRVCWIVCSVAYQLVRYWVELLTVVLEIALISLKILSEMQDCRDQENTNYISRSWYRVGYWVHDRMRLAARVLWQSSYERSIPWSVRRGNRESACFQGVAGPTKYAWQEQSLLRCHIEYPWYPKVSNKAALPRNVSAKLEHIFHI